jgi:hypothetical protein
MDRRGPCSPHWSYMPRSGPICRMCRGQMVSQRGGPVCAGAIGAGQSSTRAGGRSLPTDPSPVTRSCGLAADTSTRSRRLSTTIGPTPTSGWSIGCSDSPAYGDIGPGKWLDPSLRRHQWLRKDATRTIWPYRDWDQRTQRRHAVRRVHDRATRWRSCFPTPHRTRSLRPRSIATRCRMMKAARMMRSTARRR